MEGNKLHRQVRAGTIARATTSIKRHEHWGKYRYSSCELDQQKGPRSHCLHNKHPTFFPHHSNVNNFSLAGCVLQVSRLDSHDHLHKGHMYGNISSSSTHVNYMTAHIFPHVAVQPHLAFQLLSANPWRYPIGWQPIQQCSCLVDTGANNWKVGSMFVEVDVNNNIGAQCNRTSSNTTLYSRHFRWPTSRHLTLPNRNKLFRYF